MSKFIGIDPRLYEMAADYLMDMTELELLTDTQMVVLQRRAALAMQQAIEAECEAIRKELSA